MERINVLAIFTAGTVKPLKYRLDGVEHKVKEVINTYSYYDGPEKVFHIYVSDQEDTVSELVYRPAKHTWKI